MLSSLRKFSRDEVAQQRLRIIKFYERYGEKATKEAFGADRRVISRWRQRLHRHIIHDKPLFQKHLAEYMIFYLTKRIHKSLDKMTPLDYLVKKGGMSHLYGTYTLD